MRKLSKEHKENISKSMCGKKNALGTHHVVPEAFRASRKVAWAGNQIWKGRKHSEESKAKIAAASSKRVGHKLTPEQRLKWSEVKRGSKHPNWKGGISGESKRARESLQYRVWRENVFARDNFTCKLCGIRGVYLEADHIEPFSKFPELRFDLANGRTLCLKCHEKTETYKGRSNRRPL